MFNVIFTSVFVMATAEKISYENSLVQMIQNAGHTVEVYKVLTEDKYILTTFRLPSKLHNPKIALLIHVGKPRLCLHKSIILIKFTTYCDTTAAVCQSTGLGCSAADFVIGGKGASLTYLLADRGYDVWLGNVRGNIFSQNHETLKNTSHEFWDFSFHEIGVYDLPAIIDYALNKLNNTSLTYLGHSQGTTAFFVLLSMKPDYNYKISTAHLMAPVAYMRFPSILRLLLPIKYCILIYELFPFHVNIRHLLAFSCSKHSMVNFLCKYNYMLFGGYSSQYNEDLMPNIFQFTPASAGYKQLLHYGQIIERNGTFIQFDHQVNKNLKIYNQPQPPPYNISNIRTKMHFLYGTGDSLANIKDVLYLMAKLKTSTISITKLYNWNHFDFMYGKDVDEKVNSVIYNKMKSFA